MSTANDAFEAGRYFKAFGYYDRAFRREAEGPVRMHIRERLGETQRRLNNPVESVVYFGVVWESGRRDNNFLRSYADVLLKTANYEKAETLYQMLLGQDTENLFLQNRLASARLGLAHSDTMNVIPREKIQRQHRIATPFSQYGMVIVEGRLIYSSTQRVNPPATDQRTGHGFSHLWQATLNTDSVLWENPTPLSFNIWGDVINDGVFSWDSVNRIGYFQRCNDGNCGIFTTTLENGEWTIPQRFNINGVGATNMVGHPAISPDGRRLIFTTRSDEGHGGSDLWMTTRVDRPVSPAARRRATARTANPATSGRAAAAATRQTQRAQAAPPPPAPARRGRAAAPIITNPDWDVPVNLGPLVNSPGDEVFPVWINNEAIAFSSNGHVGFGGLDIYIALADENGNFTQVHHLGAPINSSFDDYTLVISPDINRIFFSSSRYVGFGHSDEIYSFPKTPGVMDFQFEVTDMETEFPLANVTIAVCKVDSDGSSIQNVTLQTLIGANNGNGNGDAYAEATNTEVVDRGDCEYITTDSLGRANLYRPKTASSYNITFNRDGFFEETRTARINQAIEIIPLRDVRQINVAMQRDTIGEEIEVPMVEEIDTIPPVEEVEIDTIPARWEFFAQDLEDDLVDIMAVVLLDSFTQLLGLNNICVESLQIRLNESANFTQVSEIRAVTDVLVRQIQIPAISVVITDVVDTEIVEVVETAETENIAEVTETTEIVEIVETTETVEATETVVTETCNVFYHLTGATFAMTIVTHTYQEFVISGTIDYTIEREDSTVVFRDVPFTVTVSDREELFQRRQMQQQLLLAAETQEPEMPETPAVTWFYSASQTIGHDEAELIAVAILRQDVFMISDSQESNELISPIVFNFNLDPEQFELIGTPTATSEPLLLTPERDPQLTEPISVFIDSVTFIQRVLIRSDADFRITGSLEYTLGFERAIDGDMDMNAPIMYTLFTDVPLSFTLFGLGVEDVLALEPEPDFSWADDVAPIETPIFTHRATLFEDEQVSMDECMRPGMTPQQVIDCINRRRPDHATTTVDTRFVINYSDRINDPNRRANLTVLPPDVECIECVMEPQWHPADEPLFISSSDDKQVLRFTDNAGNVTYFDLAPNTRFQISVQNFVADDIAFLPSHINPEDIIRTITTRDFVIFECMPKLSEIGEEVFVNNLFFDFDQSDIIRDGHRELDRMIIIAIKNPHFLFEIVTHADERGSREYNLALTERRMNSILDYLRRRGMDQSRLITRAASHDEPLIRNAQTEAEHALNRRATIRLIDPNRVNYLAPDYEVFENCPLYRPGLWFRVQIAAFRQAPEFPLYLFSDFLNAAPDVELNYFLDTDGLFKFTMGDFRDLNEARRLNQRILDAN
ncbi:MAG: OmpA family protein, partial [Bacteroidales bacterium]|nr:OmpA family protein [Bacteroidales bacterium]